MYFRHFIINFYDFVKSVLPKTVLIQIIIQFLRQKKRTIKFKNTEEGLQT